MQGLTAPQLRLLIGDNVLDEGILDFWKGQQRQPKGIQQKIVQAATAKGVSATNQKRLQKAIQAFEPNDPRLNNILYGIQLGQFGGK